MNNTKIFIEQLGNESTLQCKIFQQLRQSILKKAIENGRRKVKIKEVCSIEKGFTGLAKAEQGEYPLVSTGAARKTSKEYQFDAKAVCVPLVSSTGHGKKTLNYVHYQEGKFAIGSILAAIISKDESILSAKYLHIYLRENKDSVLVPLMKGAANVSLSIKNISDIEFVLPSVTVQKDVIKKINLIDALEVQVTERKEQSEMLMQSVLREAFEKN